MLIRPCPVELNSVRDLRACEFKKDHAILQLIDFRQFKLQPTCQSNS